ncbi:MAG: metallophosphoesterase, partial [Phycisphaerales bacterium JB037]
MSRFTSLVVALLAVCAASVSAQHVYEPDKGPHIHPHNPRHERVKADPSRFFTDRQGAPLELPVDDDAFLFAVFGDRTGGPAEGIEVLKQTVADVNLIEPDLVMTVGDLINGYNQTDEWMLQMQEYKGVMDYLLCPWFPVAGNHDVYWRGPNRPDEEHEARYEVHFGPLWYAFEHKDSYFIVLYSDEPNPETGERNFNKPESQRMSPEQFEWLGKALERGRDAEHIFVFLHHPRWLKGNYGDDWDKVHQRLAEAGNVSAVFAGHIHRMRYEGVVDGIEYVTLATVGGGQSGVVPSAGYLHQFHLVMVRDDQIAMASIPVGGVQDVRAITGEVSDETRRLAGVRPAYSGAVRVSADSPVLSEFSATLSNPTSRPVEVTLSPVSDDSRWRMLPDHEHLTIAPGSSASVPMRIWRPAASLDDAFGMPELSINMDYLTDTARFPIPEIRAALPVTPELPTPEPPDIDRT